MRRWHWRTESSPAYTRSIGITVSRGFGFTVSVALWRWTLLYHRRDPVIEAHLRKLAEVESRPQGLTG